MGGAEQTGASVDQRARSRRSQSGERGCEPCIDALTGYQSLSSEADEFRPDHTVEMLVEPAHVLFQETQGSTAPPDGADPDEEDPFANFPDFFFTPVGLHVRPGDVVRFRNPLGEPHTVSAYDPRFFGLQRRVPDGVLPFSSPVVWKDESWYYRFDEPGLYDLFCIPHEELGMVMRIIVQEAGCGAPEVPPLPDEGEAGISTAARTVFSAPELDPQNILDAGAVAWMDLTIETKLDPAEFFGGE